MASDVLSSALTVEIPYKANHPEVLTVKMQKGTISKYFDSMKNKKFTIASKPLHFKYDILQGSIIYNKAVEEMVYWNRYKRRFNVSDDVGD